MWRAAASLRRSLLVLLAVLVKTPSDRFASMSFRPIPAGNVHPVLDAQLAGRASARPAPVPADPRDPRAPPPLDGPADRRTDNGLALLAIPGSSPAADDARRPDTATARSWRGEKSGAYSSRAASTAEGMPGSVHADYERATHVRAPRRPRRIGGCRKSHRPATSVTVVSRGSALRELTVGPVQPPS
jgi:hypothetical protein